MGFWQCVGTAILSTIVFGMGKEIGQTITGKSSSSTTSVVTVNLDKKENENG